MLLDDVAEDGTPLEQLTSGSMRRVRVQCDRCGKLGVATWSNYLQGQRCKGRRPGQTYCQPCVAALNAAKRRGRPAPYVAAANRKRRGAKHASWRGGRYIARGGYVMVLVGGSRTCGWAKYQKEHVLVMEGAIGRKLRTGEVVHHIDNVPSNNAIENLFLTSGSGHRLAHVSLILAFQLVRAAGLVRRRTRATAVTAWRAYAAGLIVFDVRLGVYVANLKPRELLGSPIGESRGQSAAKPARNGRKVQRLGRTAQTG